MMKVYKLYIGSFKNTLMGLSMASMVIVAGCNATNTQKGVAVGASSGAVLGGVIGNQSDNTAMGAIIGATIGGAAGALIGREMDKQAEEMERDLEGVEVERVGEGIKLTFDSGLLFDVNSTALNNESITNLEELSTILKKYDDTEILIEGHTDATGEEEYNVELSKGRAAVVNNVLRNNGVDAGRLTSVGYGEVQPVASNDDAEGRQQNRRVEVAIYANKKMQKAAEKGKI